MVSAHQSHTQELKDAHGREPLQKSSPHLSAHSEHASEMVWIHLHELCLSQKSRFDSTGKIETPERPLCPGNLEDAYLHPCPLQCLASRGCCTFHWTYHRTIHCLASQLSHQWNFGLWMQPLHNRVLPDPWLHNCHSCFAASQKRGIQVAAGSIEIHRDQGEPTGEAIGEPGESCSDDQWWNIQRFWGTGHSQVHTAIQGLGSSVDVSPVGLVAPNALCKLSITHGSRMCTACVWQMHGTPWNSESLYNADMCLDGLCMLQTMCLMYREKLSTQCQSSGAGVQLLLPTVPGHELRTSDPSLPSATHVSYPQPTKTRWLVILSWVQDLIKVLAKPRKFYDPSGHLFHGIHQPFVGTVIPPSWIRFRWILQQKMGTVFMMMDIDGYIKNMSYPRNWCDRVCHHRSASLLAIAWLRSTTESGWAGTGARTAMPGKTNFKNLSIQITNSIFHDLALCI